MVYQLRSIQSWCLKFSVTLVYSISAFECDSAGDFVAGAPRRLVKACAH